MCSVVIFTLFLLFVCLFQLLLDHKGRYVFLLERAFDTMLVPPFLDFFSPPRIQSTYNLRIFPDVHYILVMFGREISQIVLKLLLEVLVAKYLPVFKSYIGLTLFTTGTFLYGGIMSSHGLLKSSTDSELLPRK